MKILFQGDSITDAFRKPEEINPAYQLGNGYAFLVASHLAATRPDRGWEFVNRGISGHKVAEIAARWEADALQIAPDLLSLLAGVNDTQNFCKYTHSDASLPEEEKARRDAEAFAKFQENYAWLLDSVLERKPETKILLLEPFLLEVDVVTPYWREHLSRRRQEIARIAGERGLPLVPLQEIFDDACLRAPAAHWAYDGIHPTHAGARLIADAWLQAAENHGLLR
ncbi:MAG: SGNH/GDSL hydrolase family protein [Verrucomicrobia bacterium]|nr:SGNH/GDSL hydrolase family protein [Verrucomicrobiota bacterium]